MRCRSILKWIGLTALSLTIVSLLSTIAHDDTASAANYQAGPQTQGALQAIDKSGSPAGECPLKHTEVKAQVPAHVEQDNASRISPPNAAAGVRAGHDISLEIDLDAGVPIVAVNSETHETEVQQVNEKRAVVRLKDHATIPNKDFLLTYRVAGDTINDAVLTHRSERGGFFTLILQPPQRVTAEDLMPKKIVFVLDTSGSMGDSP